MSKKEELAALEARAKSLEAHRDRLSEEARTIGTNAAAEGRALLTDDETARATQIKAERAKVVAQLTEARADVDDLTEEIRQDDEAEATRSKLGLGTTRVDKITEQATYRSVKEDPTGPSFFRDLYRAGRGDSGAAARLARNNEERAISTTTGAGGEFVPPKWLEDEWIPALRPSRVFADQVVNKDLPGGTNSINLPKINTGTQVASQGTQNTVIQQTDLTTTSVAAGVVTLAGSQTPSLQLIEQSPISMDDVIFGDLMADYDRQVNFQSVAGSGTGGTLKGILNWANVQQVTYTDASPAVSGAGKFLSKLAGAIQQIHTTRFEPPTHIFMSPRRWAWIEAAFDSQNRPLIVPNAYGPQNVFGKNGDGATVSQGLVGNLFGINVYADATIPLNLGAGTNQDPVLICKASDNHLYEGSLRAEAFPQTFANQLSLFCRVYNYAAFLARLDSTVAVLNGTGLVAPTF